MLVQISAAGEGEDNRCQTTMEVPPNSLDRRRSTPTTTWDGGPLVGTEEGRNQRQDHHSLLQVETTSTACLGRRQDHHSLLQSGARSTSSTTSNVWRARPTGRSPVLFLQTEDIFAKMEAVAAIHWQGGTRVTSESEAAIDL